MRLVLGLSVMLSATACSDFLNGPGLTDNPNSPTVVTARQQLIAVQAGTFTRLEGQLARSAGIYTQQLIGSNNQQLQWATQYGQSESDIPGTMSGFYTGTGLFGLRNIQAAAHAADDKLLEGIAKIWEGYTMGTAASVWGDLPYSEALNPAILPKLDAQQSIYAEVQKRFDEGITLLQAAPTTGNCDPGEGDLIYCASATTRANQVGRWIRAANTLKARFYLHLVERNGAAAYQQALAAAQAGINEAPANATQAIHGQAPGDFRSFHGSTLDQDANIWYEFLNSRQDVVAGNTLIQLLVSRGDPRLSAYFDPNAKGDFRGMDQNAKVVPTTDAASVINISVRRSPTFRQPLVTWAENQLIQAEAQFQLNGAAAALPFVNAVRVAVGMPALGAVTFQDVMIEKYIAMFQNIEVWSDWKRTCIPALTPFGTATEVPGRLPYGSAERVANPNLPLPSAYPTGTTGPAPLRNWDDPNKC
ncbi:MAG TPA: SusD/RagB family nutrient-binding outer membrane lipoprotein [Tepidiformaceae bacterium]|nr:SusD/RagB family nutrient-binding outer membrane lipoprotein [Tepidiformaceae bacterium]